MKNFEIKQFNDENQPSEINNFKKNWASVPNSGRYGLLIN